VGRIAMRVVLRELHLIGTSRSTAFTSGLSIVTGPITSGKTTLLRLCRAVFGGGLTDFPREVSTHVSAIGAEILIDESTFAIVRPFSTSPTAKVEIAGDSHALRLPAAQPDATADETYGQWLLNRLGLPYLRVPSAPTRPESEPTPVTINDYFLYCNLAQDEIDGSIFGHRDPYKNIKRRYVFQILYGIYDIETARLQEDLRKVASRIHRLEGQLESVQEFLAETRWENRAQIAAELVDVERSLKQIAAEGLTGAARTPSTPEAQALRAEVLALDTAIADVDAVTLQEERTIGQLVELSAQLRTQVGRLTRSIVAGERLIDFEFQVCPRCGAPVSSKRGDDTHCLLCLQEPRVDFTRQDLVSEQERLGTQVDETAELIDLHRSRLETTLRRAVELRERRGHAGSGLDNATADFVSDAAEDIAVRAARRAELGARRTYLRNYIGLFKRLDDASLRLADLEQQRTALQARLDQEKSRVGDYERRIRVLESRFEEILERFHAPRFADPPTARIDRQTLLPVVDGRRYDELSSQGLQVLVNVAHALAHHLTALELGLPLPGILIIDGLTSNLGHEGEDFERVRGVYDYLVELDQSGTPLQIIVADNDVPSHVQEYVRLRLTEEDRLIPGV